MTYKKKLPWGYTAKEVRGGVIRGWMRQHHYTHTCHNGPFGLALMDPGGVMAGAIAYATPCSEAVRRAAWPGNHKHVTELHRLHILDRVQEPMAVPLISAGHNLLKGRGYRMIVTFADSTEGHHGGVYRAASFVYTGTTGSRARFYRDRSGRLRHPRQSGVNIGKAEAARRGWRPEYREPKHRYLKGLNSAARKAAEAQRVPVPDDD